MKKINLFNRNINSPSYRRTPVSGGFNRGGGFPFPWERGPAEQPGGMGITPSPLSPTKFLKFCGTRFGATPSWKEGERKVPSYRRRPVSRGFNCGDGIPLFSGMTAVIFALFIATPSFAEPTELDKKTVASKAYVDTKQDKITTGLVEFTDGTMLPAITTYDSTSGLVGNKIGILDWQTAYDVAETLYLFSYEGGGYGSEMDNYVPTVRAVAESLQNILGSMPYWNALPWNVNGDNGVNRTNAINAYNSTFGNGTNNWAGTSTDLINGQFLANSLALKQNKLPELDTNLVLGQAGKSVLAPTTAGNVTQVALWDADGAEPDAWDVDTYFSDATADERNAIRYSIPTVGAVEVGLDQKQNKMTCAGWDSETHTDEHCWLWSIE